MDEKKVVNKYSNRCENLMRNNMGIYPDGMCFTVKSTMIEDAVYGILKENNVDISNITVRCVLKDEYRGSHDITNAGRQTQLPFVVILFRSLNEKNDIETKHRGDLTAIKNIRKMLNNFQDNAQFTLREENPLNDVLVNFTFDHRVHWEFQKKSMRAYTILDSDTIMALCFAKDRNEVNRYVFDIVKKPFGYKNFETGQREFAMRILITETKPKNKPRIDLISTMR